MGTRVVVVVFNTEFIVHLSLESMEDQVRGTASAEGSFDVLIFLSQ